MSVDIGASTMSHLHNDDVVFGLIGGNIYSDRAPKNVPLRDGETIYVVVQHLGARPGRNLTSTSGYTEALVQINTWGSNRTIVKAVAEAIRLALDHMTQATLGTPPNEAAIHVIRLARDPDDWRAPLEGQEDGRYGARQTARIFHDESVPTFA